MPFMLSRCLAICTLLCFSFSCDAQDIICLSNGDTVLGNVSEIGIKTITYKRIDGPEYIVMIEDIRNIILANGKQLYRMRDPRGYYLKEGVYYPPVYGDNIITFGPFQPSGNGWQYGLAYERTLKNSILGIYLPLSYARHTAGKGASIGSTSQEGSFSGYSRQMFTVAPVLKIYPWGSKGVAKYSAGPGVFFAAGNREYVKFILNAPKQADNVHQWGYFMHHAINLAPKDDLYIGFELAFGYSYYHLPAEDRAIARTLFSTGLRIGYRF